MLFLEEFAKPGSEAYKSLEILTLRDADTKTSRNNISKNENLLNNLSNSTLGAENKAAMAQQLPYVYII